MLVVLNVHRIKMGTCRRGLGEVETDVELVILYNTWF